ncbi:hypothetical protein GpartN1_g3100.t1 [Galdieria partita]|uniref:Uncharacterized protein n=1 Tax=Galdieria partita TaxID=83374 RepID=A0A9C7PVR8_9RHOD|nr:hypothetical protein GpartN1_g3100.t1 [Galdieria partita]
MLNISKRVCFSLTKIDSPSSTAVNTSAFLDENHVFPCNTPENLYNFRMHSPVSEEFVKTKKRFSRLQEETDRLQVLVERALKETDWEIGRNNYCSKRYSFERDCSFSTPQPSVDLAYKSKSPEVSFQVQAVMLSYVSYGFHALTLCLLSSTKRVWFLLKETGRLRACHRQPIILETRLKNSIPTACYSYPICREWSFSFLHPFSLWKHSFQYSKLLCSQYCKISKKKQQGAISKFVVVSDDKELSASHGEDLRTNEMKIVLTENHVTEFLSSLAVQFDDSIPAIASKLHSSEFADIQRQCLSNIPYHPLNVALLSLFRESVLEMELTRRQALAKGGLEGFRWLSRSKHTDWKDICASVFSKLYLIDDYTKSVDSFSTNEMEVIDNVILKDSKWLADYLLTEIPHLVQKEKKNFCSQVTEEVLEKICNFNSETVSSRF